MIAAGVLCALTTLQAGQRAWKEEENCPCNEVDLLNVQTGHVSAASMQKLPTCTRIATEDLSNIR
jgi:hypothetical protein